MNTNWEKNRGAFLLAISLIIPSNLMAEQTPLSERVLTKEMQQKLTPAKVIERLKAGNARFVQQDTVQRNHAAQVRQAVAGQFPKAIVLSCVDSRVPVEDVFDQGIGDLFVARVAGNFINEDILGSMEFATQVAGAKVILVLGHEHCGAIKAAIDKVQLGHISSLVKAISPAVEMSKPFDGEMSSKNDEFVHRVCENNIKRNITQIRKRSKLIKELEAKGQVVIAGAIYDMDSGKVEFL